MKKILILLLFVLSAFTASAQFNIIGANQVNVSSELRVRDTTIVNLILKWAGDAASVDALLDSIEAHRTDIDANTTALSAKQNTITGAASTIASSNLGVNRAIISDGAGKIAVSAVTSTELGNLTGSSVNIQLALDGKQNTLSGATSEITTTNLTASRIVISNGSGKIAVDPNVNTLHVGYLAGLTSSVQDQLNTKLESSDITNLFDKTVDDAVDIDYTPTETTDWPGTDPNDVAEGLDSLASRVTVLEGIVSNYIGIDTVNIGSWNMNSSVDGDVVKMVDLSGLISQDIDILNVDVIILNDAGGVGYQFLDEIDIAGTCQQCGFLDPFAGTTIGIINTTGGFFDSATFNDPLVNRGYVTVTYLK